MDDGGRAYVAGSAGRGRAGDAAVTDALRFGDAREVLRAMPGERVHCVICSPPYWGLRDYGLEPLIWGGDDSECEHEWGEEGNASGRRKSAAEIKANQERASQRGYDVGGWGASEHAALHIDRSAIPPSSFCRYCSAWSGSLGLEPTPELYVAHIVEVFREVRRVLRRDGTCWVNMGDGYANSRPRVSYGDQGDNSIPAHVDEGRPVRDWSAWGLKPKDLSGMPWRVAFALQADGWWLRSDIIWAKPNPMPESVTDRPTRSHEYVFLLSKSERYFWDADAVREPVNLDYLKARWGGHLERTEGNGLDTIERSVPTGRARTLGVNPAGRNARSVWTLPTEQFGWEMCSACKRVYPSAEYRRLRAGGTPRCNQEVAPDEQCGGTSWIFEATSIMCGACEHRYTLKGI